LNGRRVVPARLRELGYQWKRPTLESALADLSVP
jgi:NAD dependent epimerase/dehydratase family enzyme